MTDRTEGLAVLDRHALVMALWLGAGAGAIVLGRLAIIRNDGLLMAGFFAVVAAGFLAHVLVNTVLGTRFTPKEVALGLVVYVAGLMNFGVLRLVAAEAVAGLFWPIVLGFLGIGSLVIAYMVIHFGVRRAFDSFNVIRDFGPEQTRRRDEVERAE